MEFPNLISLPQTTPTTLMQWNNEEYVWYILLPSITIWDRDNFRSFPFNYLGNINSGAINQERMSTLVVS